MTLDLNNVGQSRDLGATTRRYFPQYTGPIYATGGEAGLAAALGIGKIFAVLGLTISNGTNVLHGWWDATNEKIVWFAAAGTEVTDTTDLTDYVGQIEVIGQ